MSKMRICFLAAVAAAGIGLGGTFGASAVPMNGNLVGATAPAPELQKVYYYHRHARAVITGEPIAAVTTAVAMAVMVIATVATVAMVVTVATAVMAVTVATTVVISNVVLVA